MLLERSSTKNCHGSTPSALHDSQDPKSLSDPRRRDHQWLYEAGPLKRCLRLIQIFHTESNRIPIKQELRAAREKTAEFWASKNFQPFPFIATSLLVGSSFDPNEGYQRRVHPLAFNTTFDEIDNNDGIAIVDISEPESIKYCCAFPAAWTTDQLLDTALRDPNYDLSTLTEVQQLSSFASELRRKMYTLAEPNEPPSSPSLVGCLELAFDNKSAVDLSPLSSVNAELVVEAASRPAAIISPPGSSFLYQAVCIIAGALHQLGSVLATCSGLLKSGLVRILDLSHLQQLSEKDLKNILNIESGLQTLYILKMPQISLECIVQLWSPNSAFKEIHHTELYRRPLAEKHRYSELMPMLKSPPVTDTRNTIKNILWARVLTGDWIKEPNLRKADGVKADRQRSKLAETSLDNRDMMFFSVLPHQRYTSPTHKTSQWPGELPPFYLHGSRSM
ncbi:MAG: hypothetical protein Q9166_007881 [cf. Caloplaca sp. 2 TL-2023]